MLLLPLATALLLALLPDRLRAGAVRPGLRIAGAATALLLALAVIIGGAKAGAPWLGRSAALFTVLLAYALAAAAACADAPPRPGWPGRRRDAAALAIPAIVALAALAASPLGTVALSQLALLLLVDLAGRDGWARFAGRQTLLTGSACQAVALLGAALLAAAPAAGALLLGLGFAGLGLLAPGLLAPGLLAPGLLAPGLLAPGLRPPGETLAELAGGGGLVALTLAALLRLGVTGGLPPELLLWAGIGWLLVATLELWRLPPGDAAIAGSGALALCGAALAGIGMGGSAATAGLLLLAASLLAAAACALAHDLAPGSWLRRLAHAVLALLPPFGVFAAALLLLAGAVRQAPLAALPLALGLALVCLRLAAARPTPASTGNRPTAAPSWALAALLLCNLVIGVALPPACLAWLARATSAGG